MSDAIREALQTLRNNIRQEGRTVQQIGIRDNDDTRNAIAVLLDNEAALQSQTAPAVPEGLVDAVKALDVFEPKFGVDFQDEAGTYYCEYCSFHVEYPPKGFEISHDDDCPVTTLRKLLDAAPQPDHSPDGGKVVGDHYDLGVALSRHFDELRDAETGHIAFDPCDSNDIDEVLAIINAHLSPTPAADAGKVGPVGWIWDAYGQRNFTAGTHHKNVLEADGLTLTPVYTHPAESREEIQADAERYRWLKAQYHREYCPLTIAQRVADSLFEWAAEDPSAAIDAARLRGDKGVE